MNKLVLSILILACSLSGYAQVDTRPVVGVAQFSCDVESNYAGLVTEKVVEMLTNTKRFRVVDRTSSDRVQAELELQKSEAFMDSKNTVEQDIAIAAEKMLTGHIVKIPVYAMRNPDGSIKGYKGSVAFQMKIVDVATGLSTEATSFQGKASDLMLSPESAVTQAMTSLQGELENYFRKNFPVTAKLVKVLTVKKEAAETILLGAGKVQGIQVGDKFTVERIEMLEGQPYPTLLGEVVVTKLTGETFSECSVPKKFGAELLAAFNGAQKIECKLVIQ